MNLTTDRRSFLAYFSSLGLASTLFPGVLWGKLTEARLANENLARSPMPQMRLKRLRLN